MPVRIDDKINADFEQLVWAGGYDHNWSINGSAGELRLAAVATAPDTGITMRTYTTQPGIQFYSGNFLDDEGKDGIHYGKRSGVALETQFYPDALHHPDWAQPVTKAGQRYHSETCYRFSW